MIFIPNKYPPLKNECNGDFGQFIREEKSSSPNCTIVVYRQSVIFQRNFLLSNFLFGGKMISWECPKSAFFPVQTDNPNNEWGQVWHIVAGMTDAERVLDKIVKTDKNVHLELVQANMEKENAKSSLRLAQLKNTELIDEEVNKKVKEMLGAKGGDSAIIRGFRTDVVE